MEQSTIASFLCV